jgi:hypothetical protein
VTLSFLPYGRATPSLSHRAYAAGHEVIVHLPMQPVGAENPGPMMLGDDLSPEEIANRVGWAVSRVSDSDGANNHMGSRFTTSRKALLPVMQELSRRGMFFLDSRTTAKTIAEKTAHEAGLLAGSRDVFLDGDESETAVEYQLAILERRARSQGTAIAIGHPHPDTLAAIRAWAENAEARGFHLVPLRTVLEMRAHKGETRTALAATRNREP